MLTLWYLSLVISIVSLGAGIIKKSWIFLLISAVSFIPVAWYFSGANNGLKYVGLMPLILLVLSGMVWLAGRKKVRSC